MSSSRDTESKPQRQFDIRTVERNIKKGNVTRKDYEKYLKALPDVAEKVALASDDDEDDDMLEDEDDEEEDEPAAEPA